MSTVEPVTIHLASVSAEAAETMSSRKPNGARACVGRYTTFQLTEADPVQCILEEDLHRLEAYVIALDNDIVIGTRGQVQADPNTAQDVPYPIGTLIPSKTTGGSLMAFPVHDNGAVYAGVTTIASNSRVSVAAYYRS